MCVWRDEMSEEKSKEKSKVSPQSLGGQARAKVLTHDEKKHKIAVEGGKAHGK